MTVSVFIKGMNECITYTFRSRDYDLAANVKSLVEFAQERKRTARARGYFASLTVDGDRLIYCDDSAETLSVLAKCPKPRQWQLSLDMVPSDPKAGQLVIVIRASPKEIAVDVATKDIDVLAASIRFVEEIFGLKRQPSLEAELANPPQASILIGCHFDERGKAVAEKMKKFLRLVRFVQIEVADSFRSDSIPEKVQAAIDRNDLYLGIATGERSHAWIDAEAAYALGRGKHIILAVEEGAGFKPTIAGSDREFLGFTQIEETFVGLLEEFRRLGVIGI